MRDMPASQCLRHHRLGLAALLTPAVPGLYVRRISWGFRRNMRLEEVMTRQEVLEQLVRQGGRQGGRQLRQGRTWHSITSNFASAPGVDCGMQRELPPECGPHGRRGHPTHLPGEASRGEQQKQQQVRTVDSAA